MNPWWGWVLTLALGGRVLPTYDLVIAGGRVLDPASGFDAVAWVGVSAGTVQALSPGPLVGRDTIDASGLVVSPGFIDVLSYDPDSVGAWNKLADGVTTALAMHGGTTDPDAWYARYARRPPPIHYGASFFHTGARHELGVGRYERAAGGGIALLVARAQRALQRGALGISLSPEYVPGTTYGEMLALAHLARRHGAPVFVHARYSDMEEPGTNLDALQEVLRLGRESGAAVHVEHLTSTGGTFSMAESLALLERARREGLSVTACAYPYPFWATYLNSARFDPGWQSRFGISYGDLQIAGSAERLTEASFVRHRALGRLAVAFAIPEEEVAMALRSPLVMVASDAVLEPGFNNHPRASGTFARTLGVYVRERGVLSLGDAIAKMTIMPARLLEGRAPAMLRKGRLSAGSDADITIFDEFAVTDRATVERPELTSSGIRYVIVGGRVALDPDGPRHSVRAGRPVRGVDPVPSIPRVETASPPKR